MKKKKGLKQIRKELKKIAAATDYLATAAGRGTKVDISSPLGIQISSSQEPRDKQA